MTILNRDLANEGDRLIARFIDFFVVIFIALLGIVLSEFLSSLSETISNTVALLGLFLAIFYLLCADGFEGGQSCGKRIMRIRVIDATSGKPCTFIKSFIRNISLVFLFIGVTIMIDWAFIVSDKKQRLGDRLANTIVVNKKVQYYSPQSINTDSTNTTQGSQNYENNPDSTDCYLEIEVSENQLQQREAIQIRVPFKGTTSSFQLKPEMRNKKVRLRGILEQGADLFVRVRVSTDPTPPKTPQPEPSSTSHDQKRTLRHLDVQIAEGFLFYTSIQWIKGYERATGIPRTEYDHHRPGNEQLRETIPYYSTIR